MSVMFYKRKILLVAYLISCEVLFVSSISILAVFPTPSISHQIVFRPLVQELVKRGHAVTVITTDPAFPNGDAPTNLTEIDLHDISYPIWTDVLLKDETAGRGDIFAQVALIMKAMLKVLEAQFATSDVQDIIHKRRGQFDLLLVESYVRPALIFSHIYEVPVIQIGSIMGMSYNFAVGGAPTHPLLYPTLFAQRVFNLTMYEKIHNLYKHWRVQNIFDESERNEIEFLRRTFGGDVPSMKRLFDNIDLVFLYGHPVWTNNKPVSPSIVYIGRINKIPPKQLPSDIQTILNSSRSGVIYFSLGTNVIPSLLPPATIQMMIKVFSELPYDVMWKWDQDSLPGRTRNIKIYKWLPQTDILRHPNIKLFITQCGLQSTYEAINAEVPMVGIPMLGDQWYNAEQYQKHKIGVNLDIFSLTEKQFREAIQTVISDKSYKENIKRVRGFIEDEPQNPLDRAVWWTEYVIRHGGAKHLRAAAANMSWYEYLELELVAVVVIIVLVAISIGYIALSVLWKSVYKYLKAGDKLKTS